MKRIAQNRKRITAVLMVLLLFVGAYFFGNKVVAPRRAATQAAGEAGAEAQAGEAEVDAPGAAEEVTAPVVVSSPSLVSGSAESGEDVPVSFFLADVQYLDLDSTIELMRECDVTVLTVPLAWSILEPEKGSFQVDSYWEKLDILAEQGFDFIFLLDASSRCILNEQEVVVCTSIPEWVYQEPGAMTMLDFIGSTGSARGSLSYSYPANQALYLDFCRRTIEAFDERYGESILGFAPGVMPEFEIKYPQENFAWVDFNEDAQNHFRAFLKEKSADGDGGTLPGFTEGQTFDGAEVAVTEHFTQPPKPYTEDTLLSAMENAGKEDIPEDAERKGLGTPATRAAIIEKLLAAGFVERKGKNLIPTKAGINLVTVLPEALTSPMLTAEWEQRLSAIAKGETDPGEFMEGIASMTRELVQTYSHISEDGQKLFAPEKEVIGNCPRCGKPVYEGKKNFACSDRSCTFVLWKNDRFWTSRKKELTKKMAADLLKKGRTNVKGMWSEKKGSTYDAAVILDDTGGKFINFKLEFPKRKEGANGRK